MDSDRDVVEQFGYDLDCTPVDTLMAQEGLGLSVAWSMENDDDEPLEF